MVKSIEGIKWGEVSLRQIQGTAFRDYFAPGNVSFTELTSFIRTVSGLSGVAYRGDGKLTFEVRGRFWGEVFTLYDYKGDRTIHIGGFESLDVDALKASLREELGV